MQAVIAAVRQAPSIEIREGVRARRLLTDRFGRVRGALVEDADATQTEIVAPVTILATGGLGGLYAVTTTPREMRGEGLALAALAGAAIADAEFVQFHPTAMDLGGDQPRSLPKPCAAKAPSWSTTTARRSWPAIIRPPNWRHATWWPAPSSRSVALATAPSSTPAQRSATPSRTSSRPCSPQR